MAEQFEAVDPWGLLELYWIFGKARHEYLYSVRFSAASVDPSEPQRTKPTVMREKFIALCARSSRKMGLVSGTADSWLAQVSLGNRVASFEGIVEHPETKEPINVMTGTISNIAQKSAALCYKIDASPETHAVPIPVAPRPSVARSGQAHPNRAAWMAARLKERGWDQNSLYPCGGPDRKTVQKILNGKYVRAEVLKRVVDALNHQKKNGVTVTLVDIPSD